MTMNPLVWIGLAGIGPDDNPRARQWQQRLHGVMVGIALLALPAYLLDAAGDHPALHQAATVLDGVIFCAFLLETVWMLYVTSHPVRYLLENWLNVLIIVGSGASAAGAATEWIALIRVARVAVGSLVLMRALSEFRVLFTRRGAPLLVGAAALIMLISGGVMFWLEPTVHSYWDGLWLAFVTGMTIGYGDLVPTSAAARTFAVFVAVVGVALVTLFTANVVAFFIGDHAATAEKENERRRQELAQSLLDQIAKQNLRLEEEMQALRAEIMDLKRALAGDRGTSGQEHRPSSMSTTPRGEP